MAVAVVQVNDAYERFRDQRLLPAIREVAGPQAVERTPGAEIYESHDMIKP